MRFRSWTNIALVIAVAIIATLIYRSYQSDRLGPQALTDLEPDQVRRFEVRYTGDQPDLELRGDNDGWRIVAPFERPAREARVVRVLSFIDDRIDSCYEASDERRTEFGLDTSDVALAVDDQVIAFGDRTQDGRRYVGVGERFCLVDDVAYPLLSKGPREIAFNDLLSSGREPTAIRTPAAEASRNDNGEWTFAKGGGSGQRWAVRWRSASASGFEIEAPAEDFGTVEIGLDDGETERWRIASDPAADGDLVLVPVGSDYGLRIKPSDARGLIEPPADVEDSMG